MCLIADPAVLALRVAIPQALGNVCFIDISQGFNANEGHAS